MKSIAKQLIKNKKTQKIEYDTIKISIGKKIKLWISPKLLKTKDISQTVLNQVKKLFK